MARKSSQDKDIKRFCADDFILSKVLGKGSFGKVNEDWVRSGKLVNIVKRSHAQMKVYITGAAVTDVVIKIIRLIY